MRGRGSNGASASVFVVLLALGCGGESTRSADESHGTPGGTRTAASGPVSLQLVDESGQPFAPTDVLVGGGIVVTGADGRATTGVLPETYDVEVVLSDPRNGPSVAYAFLGMSSRSPLIKLHGSQSPLSSGASLQLEKPAGLKPNEQTVFLIAGAPDVPPEDQTVQVYNPVGGSYADIMWPGSSSTEVAAEALIGEFDSDQMNVVGYSSYAATTVDLSPSDWTYWPADFASVPFDTATIHVDCDADVSDVVGYGSSLYEASGLQGPLGLAAPRTGGADLTVLDVPGSHYSVQASVQAQTGVFVAEQSDVAVGASVFLHVGAPPEALTPADGAVVGADSQFTWMGSEGSVNDLRLMASDGHPPLRSYEIATTDASVTLPDFSALGFDFPAGRELSWYVVSELGHASIDAYASGEQPSGSGYGNSRTATGASP
jgi:hypothetical protein